ncbi:MAG: LPS export ABC transporter permease LptF [Proteobacteria bacterium]|nr:LPS export ABC transporter permease LptF [Pseudomonadota bacterium]
MKLTIIDKYIAKELLTAFLSVIFVLLIIVLSTELVHLLSWVSQGFIPISALLAYLFNSLFEFSVVLLPLSLLMGILLAFGRLYRDSEMAAIMSAGIGPLQWYRPLMLIAVPVTLLLLVLLMYARPLITQQRAVITAEIQSQAEIDALMVGQFNRAGENGVLFLESEDKKNKKIENVFFQQKRGTTNHVDLADNTTTFYNEDGRRYVMMQDGTHYAGNAGDGDFKIIEYQKYGVFIAENQVTAHFSEKSKSMTELWQSTDPKDQSELQWRFTLPLATIIVAFMALPLSHTDPRSGRYAKLVVALVLYLIYSNLLGVGKTWIMQEKVPVWVGTWWVHIIAIIITVYLMKRSGYLIGISLRRKRSEDAINGS